MDSAKVINKYLERMKKIQSILLNAFIAENKDLQAQEIIFDLNGLKICNNKYEFQSLLHLLAKIYETHHGIPDDITIIENIITNYKGNIIKNFQNCEIYSIFKKDNKLLLFLIDSGILKIDEYIQNDVFCWSEKDKTYFFSEIKDSLYPEECEKFSKKIPDDFIDKRKKGENDSLLCELIRKDAIVDFISYISETNTPLNQQINESIFETDNYLQTHNPTLIEYAAFYGSIQIFNYLQMNKIELTESIWPYAIYSQNAEIMTILEDNNIKPSLEMAVKCYKKSIKCHYNNIADYIKSNYIDDNKDKSEIEISPSVYFRSYNFEYIKSEYINKANFLHFCHYDYPLLVDMLIKTEDIDLNSIIIKEKRFHGNDDNYNVIKYEHSALSLAVLNNNNEIAKILLSNNNVDINYKYQFRISAPNYGDDMDDLLFIVLFLLLVILSFYSKHFIALLLLFLINNIIKIINTMADVCNIPASIINLGALSLITTQKIEFLYNEFTVLHIACLYNNTEIANILLSKQNIDVNAVYTYISSGILKSNALNLAINNEEIVKKILAIKNIDVNFANKSYYPRQINDNLFKIMPRIILILKMITILITISQLLYQFRLALIEKHPNFQNAVQIAFCIVHILSFFINHNGFWFNLKQFVFHIFQIAKLYTVLFVLGKCLHYFNINFKVDSISFNFAHFPQNINWLKIFIIIECIVLIIMITELFSSLMYVSVLEELPLHAAIENNNIESVKLLLSNNNIDVNILYKYQYNDYNNGNEEVNYFSLKSYTEKSEIKTPLTLATEKNNTEIVKLLLENSNIDINAKCKLRSCKKIIIFNIWIGFYMLESIICSLFASSSEKTPLDIATENTNDDIIMQLQQKRSIEGMKEKPKD